MHVGDRHPKQYFEAVILGDRQYQVNSMGAVRAGIVLAQDELGELIDVTHFSAEEIDDRAAAIAHNQAVSDRAWKLAAGDA